MNVKLLTVTAIAASAALISACTPAATNTNVAKPANTTTTTTTTNAMPTNAMPSNATPANAMPTNAMPSNGPAKPAMDPKPAANTSSMKDGDKPAANAPAKEGEKKDEKK